MEKSAQEVYDEGNLCEHCPCTEYGITEVNTAPYNLCEGSHCDEAYKNYLAEMEAGE